MLAPVSMRPPIFGSPTLPAPTTRHGLPVSFVNMGKRSVTVASCGMRHANAYRRYVAAYGDDGRASQKLAQLTVRVARQKLAKVVIRLASGQVMPEQSLDRLGNFGRRAAISGETRGRLV